MKFLLNLCGVLLLATLAFAIFGGIVGCGGYRTSRAAQRNACIRNLRVMDQAKETWALEHKKTPCDNPDETEILSFAKPSSFRCPAGGKYNLGKIGDSPTCTIAGHTLK